MLNRLSKHIKFNFKNNFFSRFILFIPKRIRIVISTVFMVGVLIISTFFGFAETFHIFVPLIILFSFLSTYFAIFEGVDGVEWYMLFIAPIFLALALYFSYTLFPVRWLTRLPFIILFSLGYYGLLLTMNIFNVGVTKSLQLYRAAFSINYIAQTFIMFLFSLVVVSFRLPLIYSGFALSAVTFVLSLQLFWSVSLDKKISARLIKYSLVLSISVLQLSWLVTFLPLDLNVSALILTGLYYSLAGLLYHQLSDRLFKNIVREYLFVLIFIFLIAILTLRY